MKISIVTCTRNSMAYLSETVRSVQSQVGVNFEHIFIDGNSTDGTLRYINSLSGNIVLLEGVSGGIAKAMNEGIRVATGDVVAHLHSDDYYLDEYVLQKVVTAFASSPNKWLFGRIKSNVDGALIPEGYEVPRYSFNRFLRGNFIPHPATFIKREVFDECGVFTDSLRYAMDYDLLLRIAKKFPPIQLDEPLAAFRRHAGSTTHANFMESFAEDFHVRSIHSRWYQLPEAVMRYLLRSRRHLKRLGANA